MQGVEILQLPNDKLCTRRYSQAVLSPHLMEGLPDPSPILDLLNGFRRSKVLFTLVSLGIPSKIDKQQIGLLPLARSLSQNLGTEPSIEGLARLLDASVSLGLLGGNRHEGYYLTAVAKTYLVGEYSLAGYITHSGAAAAISCVSFRTRMYTRLAALVD